jgi:uncharacterized phiE125 gp8 family phage protein
MTAVYKLYTAAALEPISSTEAKAHLRVTGTDEDDLITMLIQAAREFCESYTNLQLLTATWEMYLDYFSEYEILIEKNPVLAITHIKYYDENNTEQTLAASVYEVDVVSQPARLVLKTNQSWPSTYDKKNAVKITFTAGFGATAASVPAQIRQAMLLVIGNMYENRGDEGHRTIPSTVYNLLDAHRVSIYK